ncbi:23S rRNA pseudouridine955/2504/2580 synthase [Nitrosomonas sp. Nm51]|uniref:RluA family pseudouridine synthase n=1 Tax=Nitrosomonas sp. Nm51 TaxID=133720 RepID=UPI0008AD4279|nr:RluA family pseudouridine synthase [Nitrosomonas sp. Nm51]SER24425.1 23S rRNA pseudouridine955/2504/2580 synthase [Nitrosomonas sp. Nm51]
MNASVVIESIVEDGDNQRIDNFFFKRFKNVPKSHIYQLLRSGQVRVNGKRVNFHYRLHAGDLLRIPPVRTPLTKHPQQRKKYPAISIAFDILFEDDALLAINKPSGMAVHGGSGVSFGVIEQLRAQRQEYKFLELVHRLDRETSGVLMLAKKRSALVELHRQIRSGQTEKHYQVMVKGKWSNPIQNVKLPLIKYMTTEGERRVAVAAAAGTAISHGRGAPKVMAAHTLFKQVKVWQNFSMLDAELKTGRTHQIRVHLAHLGYPIVGDDKYGDFVLNKQLARNRRSAGLSLARMFLHASCLRIKHPLSGQKLGLKAPLPADLQTFITQLE